MTWHLLTTDVDVLEDQTDHDPAPPPAGAVADDQGPPVMLSPSEIQWRRVGQALGHKPVVINVPALDPANAFLAPILAHEVAHVAVDHRLMNSLAASSDDELVERLRASHVLPEAGVSPEEQRLEADGLLVAWLCEELCDAVACALTGPAFLFAAAAFIPAPGVPTMNRHPFPRDRLRWALRFLDRLGWTEYLLGAVPECMAYLSAQRDVPEDRPQPYETFLRAAVDAHIEPILDLVMTHVPCPLTPARFSDDDQAFGLVDALRLGYIPRLEGETPGLWAVLLAGWMAWLSDDDPVWIPAAVADADVNAFLIKTLELVQVTELWLNPA